MEAFKIFLSIIFILIAIALVVIVLLQEGKSAGLGAISGIADTYWGKNKGRSMEGKLEKGTKYLVIGFLAIAIFLYIPFGDSKASNTDNDQPTATEFYGIDEPSAPDNPDDFEDETTDNDTATDDAVE